VRNASSTIAGRWVVTAGNHEHWGLKLRQEGLQDRQIVKIGMNKGSGTNEIWLLFKDFLGAAF
jgi:hypothetical protein